MSMDLDRHDSSVLDVAHVIKGETVIGDGHRYAGGAFEFSTASLDLEQLTWSRLEPCPASDVPVHEIVEVLVATGEAMSADRGGHMSGALDRLARSNVLDRALLERMYAELPSHFDGERILGTVRAELGGTDVLDGWREVRPGARVRAYPPRLIHILAGNAPVVAPLTVIRSAVTKGVSLLKLPSNDLFTVPAVLRCMAEVAPGHAVTRSFSAVYWRGGDAAVEGALFRSLFFDKIVAWGGDAAIRGVIKYLAPGLELVSFDPKTSMSMVGREAFTSEESLSEAAEAAAIDVTLYNQEACASARIQFVEGTTEQVDRFCSALLPRLAVDRPTCTAASSPVPDDLRDEITGLRGLEPDFKVWGRFDGSGMVIRSEEPVDFHPSNRVVNVVRVDDLKQAIQWVNVATQGMGVYPPERRDDLYDSLAQSGVQSVFTLGTHGMIEGLPHDGMFPVHRFVKWVSARD